MRRAPLVVACLLLLGIQAGCRADLDCFQIGDLECRQVAGAARTSIPAGAAWLHVAPARGGDQPSYHVFACYPDLSQVVVEVTFTGGGDAKVVPADNVELASCRR